MSGSLTFVDCADRLMKSTDARMAAGNSSAHSFSTAALFSWKSRANSGSVSSRFRQFRMVRRDTSHFSAAAMSVVSKASTSAIAAFSALKLGAAIFQLRLVHSRAGRYGTLSRDGRTGVRAGAEPFQVSALTSPPGRRHPSGSGLRDWGGRRRWPDTRSGATRSALELRRNPSVTCSPRPSLARLSSVVELDAVPLPAAPVASYSARFAPRPDTLRRFPRTFEALLYGWTGWGGRSFDYAQ